MNLKELAGTIVTCAAAASLIYGAGLKSGLIIGRADASDMIQQKALELQRKYDRQVLELDIRSLTTQINQLTSKPDRTEWDDEQIRTLRVQLDAKVKLLAEMDKPE